MTTASPVYSAAAWSGGPDAVYDRCAHALLADALMSLRGRRCLDLGAGTGAVSRLLHSAGARVVALDISPDMLAWQADRRPPAVVGDALALPVRAQACDAVVAAFCFNHFADPRAAVTEAARVLRPGGRLLASTWPAGRDPVKAAAAAVLERHGWHAPAWYAALHDEGMTADPAAMVDVAAGAGFTATARVVDVALDLPTAALVAWRTGLPHVAGWLDELRSEDRRAVLTDLHAALLHEDGQPWVVRMLVLSGRRAA